MKDMNAAERSKPQLTKTQCTGFFPVNISLWVFLQKWTLEPKSLLKHVQNYPGNIYNINSKTVGKAFLNRSLMYLCHLVNKAQLQCFCEREDRILVPSEILVGSEVCFGGSLGSPPLSTLLGCQFQTLEGQQINVTWQTRATKSSSVSQGKKKKIK